MPSRRSKTAFILVFALALAVAAWWWVSNAGGVTVKCLRFETVDGEKCVIVAVENTSSHSESYWGAPGKPQFHFRAERPEGLITGPAPQPTMSAMWPIQSLAAGERIEVPVRLWLASHHKSVDRKFQIALKLVKDGRTRARSFLASLGIPAKYLPEQMVLVWSDVNTAPN